MTVRLPPPMTVVPPESFELVASDCDAPTAAATLAATLAAGGGGRGGNGDVGRVGEGMISGEGGLSLLLLMLLIVKPFRREVTVYHEEDEPILIPTRRGPT